MTSDCLPHQERDWSLKPLTEEQQRNLVSRAQAKTSLLEAHLRPKYKSADEVGLTSITEVSRRSSADDSFHSERGWG